MRCHQRRIMLACGGRLRWTCRCRRRSSTCRAGRNGNWGVAYLFITHNIGVVEYIADDVAVMQAGRIVEQGPCAQVLGAPQQDYTRRLLAAVPRLGRSGAAA